MVGFYIKKGFYDIWDNFLLLFLLNIGFAFILGIIIWLPYFLSFSQVLSALGLCAGLMLFHLYTGAAARLTGDMADCKSVSFRSFTAHFREGFAVSLTMGGIAVLQVVILLLILPFYFQVGGLPGLAAMSLIFWTNFFWLLAAQYYHPVAQRLDTNVIKVIKKSLMLLMDNLPFTLFMGLGSCLIFFLLIPGIAAVLLWQQTGLRLRLYKYDYLDAHPGAVRNEIPWETLLEQEKEQAGSRSFKSLIFPWKE